MKLDCDIYMSRATLLVSFNFLLHDLNDSTSSWLSSSRSATSFALNHNKIYNHKDVKRVTIYLANINSFIHLQLIKTSLKIARCAAWSLALYRVYSIYLCKTYFRIISSHSTSSRVEIYNEFVKFTYKPKTIYFQTYKPNS